MKGPDLLRAALGRHANRLRSAAVLTLVFVVGFTVAWFWPDHTATPTRISGTVTWSNTDAGKLLFEADDDGGNSGEYAVAAVEWFAASGARHAGGDPSCLATSATDSVRTDRRHADLEFVSVDVSGSATRIAVIVHCLT
ncbi:hypothetical protein Areg01_50130 [Actinoplanes regularis]|nr:hypothetical protein Areg01_50130 [Actinoplanes regularis]